MAIFVVIVPSLQTRNLTGASGVQTRSIVPRLCQSIHRPPARDDLGERMKSKKQICGGDCEACVICEKSPTCCMHNAEHHGCHRWRRHDESPDCWCHPTLTYKDEENGNEVWTHNGIQ